MATTPIKTDLPLFLPARQASVYIRQNWSDEWALEPYLYCDSLTWCANPHVQSATLNWEYGVGVRQEERTFAKVQRQTLADWFVKIEVEQLPDGDGSPVTAAWYGVILADSISMDGPLEDDMGRSERGSQRIIAYGLEILLDREPITTAVYKSLGGDVLRAGRALTFNPKEKHKGHGEFTEKGNRTASEDAAGSYLFAGDVSEDSLWSTADIVDYLLLWHLPGMANSPIGGGTTDIEWEVEATSAAYLPTWDNPNIRTEGKTVKDILDELLDRRRLLGYRVQVDADTNKAQIRPFTFTDEAVAMSGGSIAANGDQKSFDFDMMPNVERAFLKKSSIHKYDAVTVRGDRVLCCGTFSRPSRSLDQGWSYAQEMKYREAATTSDGYAELELYEKDTRNRQARASDEFSKVYTSFIIPENWDGNVSFGDFNSGIEESPLFPFVDLEVDSAEETRTVYPWYPPEMRFEHFLPLKTEHDYKEDNIYDKEVPDATENGAKWEYLRPLVCLRLPLKEDQPEYKNRWVQAEKLGALANSEISPDGGGLYRAYHVRMEHESPGISLRSSAPQHSLAKDTFTAVDESDTYEPEFDWRFDIIATLAVRADYAIQQTWPKIDPEAPPKRILTIEVGDHAQAHYVAPGTVVAVTNGALVLSNGGGLIRDDRGMLMNIAKAAYAYYGQERQVLEMVWGGCEKMEIEIGDMIVEVGGTGTTETVRTVVTQIQFEFATSEHSLETCSLETSWAALDAAKML